MSNIFFSPLDPTFTAKDFRGFLPASAGRTKCHLLCSIILFVIPFFLLKCERVVQWEVKRRRVRTAREKTPLAENENDAAEDQSYH